MSVPEAPVDEDTGAVFAEDDVGLSRQSFAVDAIAESLTPQPFAHDDLRLRVFRADCRHRSMALNWRKGVSHYLIKYCTNSCPVRYIGAPFILSL